MRLFLLVLAAVVLPYVWGCAVFWFLKRIWPPTKVVRAEPTQPVTLPTDFQI